MVDARLERERPADQQPGDGKRGYQPQPERHESDGTKAADGGHGRQDQRLDRDPSGGFGRRGLVGEDLERPQEHGAEQQDGDQPDQRRFDQARQPDQGHGHDGEVAMRRSIVQ